MKHNRTGVLGSLCFAFPLTIGLTYPVQVLYGSSLAGVAALVVAIALTGLASLVFRRPRSNLSTHLSSRIWDWLVCAILTMSIANTTRRTTGALGGVLVEWYMLALAALTYLFFSRIATAAQTRRFFAGVVLMGLTSGTFFVYESFMKVVSGQVTTYSQKAQEYTLQRTGASADDPSQNLFRIDERFRSFGLLERHTTSALWIAFGFFAYAFLDRRITRVRLVFALTILSLLAAQNFTAIVVFLAIVVTLHRNAIRVRSIITVGVILGSFALLMNREKIVLFFDAASFLLQAKVGYAISGTIGQGDASYTDLLNSEFGRFMREMSRDPWELLFGYGLGDNPHYGTSGDVGFFESIARLGLPLWLGLSAAIAQTCKIAIRAGRRTPSAVSDDHIEETKLLIASASLLAAVWMLDAHYSVWIYKSVWPIFFFGMAVARRIADASKVREIAATTLTN